MPVDEAYTHAWQTITDVNPFPAVMGRVCPHPCESHCNRSTAEEPLAINAMERFLGDWGLEQGLALSRLEDGPPKESIGVIGAGPSGLSFAYQLARRGYRVTVYERHERPGGMLRYGIPDYRLPPEVLDGEIQRILDLGVELKLSVQIGRDVTLDELRAHHDVMYLGIGAQKGRGLGIPGENGPSVWTGTDYLERVNRGEAIDVGRRVVVVGGGNTAIDAARTARRAGADVTILYRRSRAEMPAIAEEVDDALEEGVTLSLQTAPVRLEREGGVLRALVACRMELAEPDASGRRRPVAVPDSEFVVPAETVIAAVSQEPDVVGFEALAGEHGRLVARDGGAVDSGVVAGGDVLGQGIAAQAIVAGRYAAEALHARLRGLPETPRVATMRPEVGPDGLLTDFHAPQPAAHRRALVAGRASAFADGGGDRRASVKVSSSRRPSRCFRAARASAASSARCTARRAASRSSTKSSRGCTTRSRSTSARSAGSAWPSAPAATSSSPRRPKPNGARIGDASCSYRPCSRGGP